MTRSRPGTMLGSRQGHSSWFWRQVYHLAESPRGVHRLLFRNDDHRSIASLRAGRRVHQLQLQHLQLPPTPTPTAWLAHIEILVDSYAEPYHYFCGSALSRTYDQSPESSAHRTTQQHAGHQEYPNPFAQQGVKRRHDHASCGKLHVDKPDWHFAGKFSHPCKILGTFPLQFP